MTQRGEEGKIARGEPVAKWPPRRLGTGEELKGQPLKNVIM